MNPNQLAQLLAERMQEVVPAGFTVECDPDGMLCFDDRASGSYAPQWLLKGYGDIEQRIQHACWVALGDLQDVVCEETTEPWPGTKVFPRAGALIDGGQVHLWYGDIREPSLRLRPIPLESPLADPLEED